MASYSTKRDQQCSLRLDQGFPELSRSCALDAEPARYLQAEESIHDVNICALRKLHALPLTPGTGTMSSVLSSELSLCLTAQFPCIKWYDGLFPILVCHCAAAQEHS